MCTSERNGRTVLAGEADMGEQLTPPDATLLELEEADESAHVHIGSIRISDPRPGSAPPTCLALSRADGCSLVDGARTPSARSRRASSQARR
jgi:hypothetical protein